MRLPVVWGRFANQETTSETAGYNRVAGSWGRLVRYSADGCDSPKIVWPHSSAVDELCIGEDDMVVIRTASGEVFFNAKAVALPSPAIKICAGNQHALVLCRDGSVCALGSDEFGQCGGGGLIPLPGRAIDVAAGALHSIILLASGQALVSGWLAYSQGGGEPVLRQPTFIEIDVPFKAHRAACGTWHTVLLSDSGSVWSVGSNQHDQLPPASESILAIAAGSAHTALLRSDGTVALFGFRCNDSPKVLPESFACSSVELIAFGWTTVVIPK